MSRRSIIDAPKRGKEIPIRNPLKCWTNEVDVSATKVILLKEKYCEKWIGHPYYIFEEKHIISHS